MLTRIILSEISLSTPQKRLSITCANDCAGRQLWAKTLSRLFFCAKRLTAQPSQTSLHCHTRAFPVSRIILCILFWIRSLFYGVRAKLILWCWWHSSGNCWMISNKFTSFWSRRFPSPKFFLQYCRHMIWALSSRLYQNSVWIDPILYFCLLRIDLKSYIFKPTVSLDHSWSAIFA